jgi:DNA-binding MarR family transcriptional regulator
MTSPTTPTSADTTPDVVAVEHLIRQLYGLGGVRRELSRAAGRSATHSFAALGAVHHRGPCRVSDIASDLQVDLSVASRQIAGHVTDGLLERRPDPDDGRAQLLHLTPAGHDAIHQAHGDMVAVLGAALADWSPADVSALGSGLERLVQSFTNPVQPLTPPPAEATTAAHADQQEIAR